MNRLFFVLAWRNMLKRKFYAFREITGLAIGLTCFLGAIIYLKHELSYDSSFSHSDSIYRIVHVNGEGKKYSGLPSALATHIREEISQVEEVVRIFWPMRMFSQNNLVQHDSIRFYENQLIVADSNFFKLFDFEFLEGNPSKALTDKNSVVLSHSAAIRYFGNESAYGKTLQIGIDQLATVSGVVTGRTPTHISFDFLQPIQAYPNLEYTWNSTLAFTYVKVDDETQIGSIEKSLYAIVLKHSREEIAAYLKSFRHTLQRLKEVHHTVIDWDIVTATSPQQLYAVSLIALFILVLAIINFINLSTSRLGERLPELGVNSVLGAASNVLIKQVYMEYALVILFASMLGVLLLACVFPLFNTLLGTNILLSESLDTWLAIIYTFILFAILILSGIYPAFALTKFRPVEVLKRQLSGNLRENRMRKLLVVFQFLIGCSLISATLIVNRQIDFLRNIELGFDKDQVLVLRLRAPDAVRFNQLKTRLLSNPAVKEIGGASTAMGLATGSDTFHTDSIPEQFANTISVDYDFLDVMDIQLIQGRKFNLESQADLHHAYIINESAVKQFNLQNPVGERFTQRGQNEGRIIGVVKDFYYQSTSKVIKPLVLNVDTVGSYRYMFVKVSSNISSVIRYIENTWQNLMPEFPFEYEFQDRYLDRLYENEKQAQRLSTVFSVLSIVVALLGLLGLSSFIILKRTKEIGMRKVIGASVGEILLMIMLDFIKLISVGLLISIPVTYFAMSRWLEAFVNRISIHPFDFLLSGGIIILLALVVVGYKALLAATANPVRSLRND